MTRDEERLIEELYRSMLPTLIAYGSGTSYDKHLVQDAVQETFRVVCERIDVIAEHENPEAWVMTAFKYILRRAGQDRAKDLAILERLSLGHGGEGGKSDSPDPDLLYGDLADNEDYKLLRRLAERGCTMSELARELNISVSACEKRVQRARKRLQKYFKNL